MGEVKIAEDDDFQRLKKMVDDSKDWIMEFDKGGVRVFAKQAGNCSVQIVKVLCHFPAVQPMDLYDVIHDPDYRKIWDHSMIESVDIGHLNPNNDISYYAVSCPTPMTNRDFVLQRSWLDTGKEQYIINHSVFHKDFPPRRGYIRANSIFTGYLIRQINGGHGCTLGYVTQSDLQGDLPLWLVNKCTNIFAPKYVKQLEKAAMGYRNWKASHNPNFQPWHYPEQINSPKILIAVSVVSVEEPVVIPPTSAAASKAAAPILVRPQSLSLMAPLNEPTLSSPKHRLLSCFDFTKHCIGRSHDPNLS